MHGLAACASGWIDASPAHGCNIMSAVPSATTGSARHAGPVVHTLESGRQIQRVRVGRGGPMDIVTRFLRKFSLVRDLERSVLRLEQSILELQGVRENLESESRK